MKRGEFGTNPIKTKKPKIKEILSDVPAEKAFYFYSDIGVYTGRQASSLRKFYGTLKEVDPRSITFHMQRRDFEEWVNFLGDTTLAMKIAELGKAQISAEILRSKLYDAVKKRCDELEKES